MKTKRSTKKKGKNWFHEIVAKQRQLMDQNVLIWQHPLKIMGSYRNTNGIYYHGVNVVNLSLDCLLHGWENSVFITSSELKKRNVDFSQYAGQGLHSVILRWVPISKKIVKKDTEMDEEETINYMTLKYVGTVWNIELFPEIQKEVINDETNSPHIPADQIIDTYMNRPASPSLVPVMASNKIFYNKTSHQINVPPISAFLSSEHYYDAYFHEIAHSTGHPTLLNRKTLMQSQKHGDNLYSQEELVAEFTSAFLGAEVGIDRSYIVENNAAYIQGWWERLQRDERLFTRAFCQAQQIFYHVMGLKYDDKSDVMN